MPPALVFGAWNFSGAFGSWCLTLYFFGDPFLGRLALKVPIK
jgi:hypothetical protein